jgi:hypothetical protein
MSKSAYTRYACRLCGKEISTSGGSVNHYRKHVREGLMIEVVRYAGHSSWHNYELTETGRAFREKRLATVKAKAEQEG